jgi:large subunit ribosomal protein L30
MVYLVVRMKGTINVPYWARITLDGLHLNKRFRATIIPENEQTLGMLRKIKEFVSWVSVDDVFVREFLEKKGRVSSSRLLTASSNSASVPATSTAAPNGVDGQIDSSNNKDKESHNNADLGKIVSIISQNEVYLSKISGIKPWFALNPPKGGFKRKSKRSYSQNGILGENKELVSIVKRMM